MDTINIVAEVLGLSDIEIESVKLASNREIIISVVSTHKEINCRQCNRPI